MQKGRSYVFAPTMMPIFEQNTLAEPHFWYAVRTFSNRETVLRSHLTSRGIECYLPTYNAVRIARRGPTAAPRPLIPGYVFARFPLTRRADVVSAPGAAWLLGDSTGPTVIPDQEIETLRVASENFPTQPARYPEAGEWVRISGGLLDGVSGIVQEIRGNARVVVRVHSIRSAFMVEIDAARIGFAADPSAISVAARGAGQ
jgi:transcription antitermination factor NusG